MNKKEVEEFLTTKPDLKLKHSKTYYAHKNYFLNRINDCPKCNGTPTFVSLMTPKLLKVDLICLQCNYTLSHVTDYTQDVNAFVGAKNVLVANYLLTKEWNKEEQP